MANPNPFADKAMSLSNAFSSNMLIPGDSKMRDLGKEVGVSSWVVCMRGDPRQSYVSNCVMQNLQFLLLAIEFFSKDIATVIDIPKKKLKKQNRI